MKKLEEAAKDLVDYWDTWERGGLTVDELSDRIDALRDALYAKDEGGVT